MDEDPTAPPDNALLKTLKAHRFYGAAVGYLVAAWIVLQVAAIVLPGFGAPAWALRVLMVLLALGLGATLLAVWGKDRRARSLSLLPQTPHTRLAWVLTAVLPAALVTVFFLLHPLNRPASAPAVAAGPADKSVAVLPFDNFSEEKDSAFFADGVQDEVLTDLSKVADLKVISRSSVMQYKKTDARNLRDIGKTLGVSYVVEGSVQRAGNRIRVTAQLIDARTDTHLWAEHYDRPLDDVFAIQSEIAATIADQLRSKLSPAVKADIAGQPTTDLKAYELYVRARAVLPWNDPDGAQGSLDAKVALLEAAVQQDQNFALAYCELAKTQDDYEGYTADGTHLIPARQAAEKALFLRPGLGEGRREMARYYLRVQDFGRAHDEAVAVLRVLPNDAEALRLVSQASSAQDHWDEALASMEKAHALDPANYEYSYYLGAIYRSMRRYKEWEQMLSKNPPTNQLGTRWVQVLLAEIKLDTGDPVAARDCLVRVPSDFAPTPEIWVTRFTAALYLRDYDAAERAIAATPREQTAEIYVGNPPLTWDNAMLARLHGDETKAQAILAAARQWTTTGWEKARRERVHLWLLSRCDAGMGHKEDAIREARQVCAEWPLSRNPGVAKIYSLNLALVYAQTGERAQAIDELEVLAKMYDTVTYGDLHCSPYWDPLRGDPRFEALVASLAPKP